MFARLLNAFIIFYNLSFHSASLQHESQTSDIFSDRTLPPHLAYAHPSEGRNQSCHCHRRMKQRQAARY